MNVPPHTMEQNRRARSAWIRLLKISSHCAINLLPHESKHPTILSQRWNVSISQPAIMSESETLTSRPIDPPRGVVETSLIGATTNVATNHCDFLHLRRALD